MAAMICPECRRCYESGETVCDSDGQFLVPEEQVAGAEPEEKAWQDSAAPTEHSAGATLLLRFPWGEVDVGATELPVGRSRRASPLAEHITDDTYGNVSRRHAVLWQVGGRLFLRDLESTNGTFVNEKRLPDRQPLELRAGDQVRFAALLTASVVERSGFRSPSAEPV